MIQAIRFPYIDIDPAHQGASRLPYLPLILVNNQTTITVSGLLDTGATVNVLPYSIGLQLGLIWTNQTTPVQLTGNLSQAQARAVFSNGLITATCALSIRMDAAYECTCTFRSS